MNDQPMDLAIRLARQFRPHPNPRVGAVIVDQHGQLVGEGAHAGQGFPHAEVIAIAAAGERSVGSTMYVTLEPCNHTGETGPCASAIISAGIMNVVVGVQDPDHRVAGAGVAALRAAGISVEFDASAPGLRNLDPGYFHHRKTGRPRFTLKTALTLDGQVAAKDGSSQWITGEEARLDGHRLRAEADAVLVGAGTLLADDPCLDVRLPGYEGPQPRPIVIAGHRRLPETAQIFGRNPVVVSCGAIAQPGEELIVLSGEDGRPDLVMAAASLGRAGWVDVLVEGGPTLAGEFLAAGLIDRGVWYLASKLAGGIGHAAFSRDFERLSDTRPVEIVDVRKVGADLRVEFVMEDHVHRDS